MAAPWRWVHGHEAAMAQELRRGGGGSGFLWASALSLPSLFLGPDLVRVAPSLNRLPFEVSSTWTCWAAQRWLPLFYLVGRAGVGGQGTGSALMGAPKCRDRTRGGASVHSSSAAPPRISKRAKGSYGHQKRGSGVSAQSRLFLLGLGGLIAFLILKCCNICKINKISVQ